MKKKTKLLILSVIATLAFSSAMASCGKDSGGGDGGAVTPPASSESIGGSEDVGGSSENSSTIETPDELAVTINGSATVMEFDSITLLGNVTGSDEALTILWTSSDDTIASVDQNGVVTAHKAGTVTITASVDGASATHELTVTATNILHEIEFDMPEVKIYEGEFEMVEASVSYNGETLDNETYGLEYTWEKIEGDEGVVTVVTDGATATFTAGKSGTALYKVSTTARGYKVEKTISITVLDNEYSYALSNDKISEVGATYKATLTLVDDATLEIGTVYGVLNGVPQADELDVVWSTDSENISVVDGVITALKAGEGVITGTTAYGGESLSITLSVTVNKALANLSDTLSIETAATTSMSVPAGVTGNVLKVSIGNGVLFDGASGAGSIEGNEITFDQAGMPCKAHDLGEGKTMVIETETTIYSMVVDVYTMIINTAEELDQWQAVAAENAIKDGSCLEIQKGLVYTGYFVLGDNIEYNKVWNAYKKYGQLWALCYNTPSAWQDGVINGTPIDGAIIEDWGAGRGAGFKGVFDGKGHYIEGIETSGEYSSFIITMGVGGIIRNVAFTEAKIGAGATLVADRGIGTVENVYVEVASIADGNDASEITAVVMRNTASADRIINNVVVDVSKVDLSNWKYGYICDMSCAQATNVFVLGDANLPLMQTDWALGTGGAAFWHLDTSKGDSGAVYSSAAVLFTNEEYAGVVSTWDSNMWLVNPEGALIAQSVAATYGGDVAITNTETEVPANGSLALSTDKDARFIVYSVKEANAMITVNGNVVSVSGEATVGEQFTIVATSLLDGKSDEITFTVGKYLDKVTAETAVDVELNQTISHRNITNGTETTVDLSEIYDEYIAGKTVTVTYGEEIVYEGTIESATWTMSLEKFALTDSGLKSLVFSYSTEEKNGEITLPINVKQTVLEISSSIVANSKDLVTLLNLNPSGHFVLTEDLAMEARGLFVVNEFNGILDGQGHVITGTWLHHDSDTNGYNPQFIALNTGVIKNLGIKLDYLTIISGGRKRGFVNVNAGTIENVYVDVTIKDGPNASQTDSTYFNTGILAHTNEGTINNSVVYLTINEGVALRDKTIAAISFENLGTITNSYGVINNLSATEEAPNNAVAVMKGSVEGATLVEGWTAVTEEMIASLSDDWSVAYGAIYFGSMMVYDPTVYTVIDTEYKTNSDNQVVLESASLTVGSTWEMTIGAAVTTVTIEEEGKLEVTIDPTTVSSWDVDVLLKGNGEAINFSNVIVVTQRITTVEELVALGVGGKDGAGFMQNSGVTGNDKNGYYLLANDLDFSTYTANHGLVAAGYSYQQSFFKGVFDGDGKTIKNISVSAGGIFGGMDGATVKNVNFTGVIYNETKGHSYTDAEGTKHTNVDGFYGNYTALLAAFARNCVFTDINVQVANFYLQRNSESILEGLLVENTAGIKNEFKNIVVDASYLMIENALSFNHTNQVYDNVVIKAAGYKTIAYEGGGEATTEVTEWPTGVTFETVALVTVENAPLNTNYEAIAEYDGDVTALGFAEGSHVFAIESADLWTDRILLPADSDNYDYVEFDIVLGVAGSLTAWPSSGDGTQGSMSIVGSQMTATDGNARTIQVWDANGNTFAAQYRNGFAANTRYTVRVCFVEGETVKYLHLGLSNAQTYYVTNTRWGNFDVQNDVYTNGTGALLAKYEGDVTALGFAEGSTVTQVSIAGDAWGNRVGINANVKYDYVDVKFSFTGDRTVYSLCVWMYNTDSTIRTGNYTVNAAGGTAANGAEERTLQILDANGNAIEAMAANTVYTLRVYLDANVSTFAVSTFETSADSSAILNFGDITYGNEGDDAGSGDTTPEEITVNGLGFSSLATGMTATAVNVDGVNAWEVTNADGVSTARAYLDPASLADKSTLTFSVLVKETGSATPLRLRIKPESGSYSIIEDGYINYSTAELTVGEWCTFTVDIAALIADNGNIKEFGFHLNEVTTIYLKDIAIA